VCVCVCVCTNRKSLISAVYRILCSLLLFVYFHGKLFQLMKIHKGFEMCRDDRKISFPLYPNSDALYDLGKLPVRVKIATFSLKLL